MKWGVAIIAGVLLTAQAQEGHTTVAPVFAPILKQLQQGTTIPVRLPGNLPDLGQGQDPIYAVVEFAKPAGYSIILGFTPDCNGASVCRLGTLGARRVVKGRSLKGKRVSLARGIVGIYREASCGANCSDSVITWREGAVEYSAGVKAGSEEDARKLANAVVQGK